MSTAPPHVHHDRPLVCDGEQMRSVVLKWVFCLPRFLYKLYFALVFFATLTVLYVPFRLVLRRERTYPMAFLLMRAAARFMSFAMFVPQRVLRRAPLPKPPYIICANHGSYLDIVHMYNAVPDYFLFMGKYELLKWPLLGMFFKRMNIAVNRGNRTEAVRSLVKAARAIDHGTCVSLFPEGTIPLTAPRMKHFKDGAFKLAIEKQVPIVPITFLDHWKLLGEPGEFLSRGHPGLASTVIHPYVETKGLAEADLVDLRHRIYDIIEAPLKKYAPNPNGQPPTVL
jgi:1-acyl-sn-glycerol-3-phosphate acyltransferase